MREEIKAIIAANTSRAGVYRVLASLFFKELTDEQLDNIKQLDFTAFEGMDPLFAEGCADMSEYLSKKNTATRSLLACDYSGAILGAGYHDERRATPFESVFTSSRGLLMQEARDEVYKTLLRAQLEVNENLHIPEDHLSFMFEYLAVMADRCNEALEAGNLAEALENLEHQQQFHREHLLNWIDVYCDTLADCAETGFYVGVSKMTRSFVHLDEELLQDLIDAVAEEAGEEGLS